MDLTDFLHQLEALKASVDGEDKPESLGIICIRFHELLSKLLESKKSTFEDRLQSLQSSLEAYSTTRLLDKGPNEEADALGHYIFIECARLVLGIEFHRLEQGQEPRSSFHNTISATFQKLHELPVGHFFLVLQWLMINYWNHPILMSMMKEEDLEEERALTYLRSGEFPELFCLRIEMLVESGIENYALNLCNWCLRSPVFKHNVFVRLTQLLLLHKCGRQQEFHSQCWHVKTAVPSKLVELLLDEDERQSTCLMIAQTFLLQDWTKPDKFCCTKELLTLWIQAQRQEETDNLEFLSSVEKVSRIAKATQQLVTLVQVMYEQFDAEFLQFLSDVCLRAIRLDRHLLDSARIKRQDHEMNQAADGLSKECWTIYKLYSCVPENCEEICLSSLLTSFYLDPKESTYRDIERLCKDKKKPPTREIRAPPGVEEELFGELYELVETLRPAFLQLKAGWVELKRLCITQLRDAGFRYNRKTDSFLPVNATTRKPAQAARKQKQSNVQSDVAHENSMEIEPERTVSSGSVPDTNTVDTTPEGDQNLRPEHSSEEQIAARYSEESVNNEDGELPGELVYHMQQLKSTEAEVSDTSARNESLNVVPDTPTCAKDSAVQHASTESECAEQLVKLHAQLCGVPPLEGTGVQYTVSTETNQSNVSQSMLPAGPSQHVEMRDECRLGLQKPPGLATTDEKGENYHGQNVDTPVSNLIGESPMDISCEENVQSGFASSAHIESVQEVSSTIPSGHLGNLAAIDSSHTLQTSRAVCSASAVLSDHTLVTQLQEPVSFKSHNESRVGGGMTYAGDEGVLRQTGVQVNQGAEFSDAYLSMCVDSLAKQAGVAPAGDQETQGLLYTRPQMENFHAQGNAMAQDTLVNRHGALVSQNQLVTAQGSPVLNTALINGQPPAVLQSAFAMNHTSFAQLVTQTQPYGMPSGVTVPTSVHGPLSLANMQIEAWNRNTLETPVSNSVSCPAVLSSTAQSLPGIDSFAGGTCMGGLTLGQSMTPDTTGSVNTGSSVGTQNIPEKALEEILEFLKTDKTVAPSYAVSAEVGSLSPQQVPDVASLSEVESCGISAPVTESVQVDSAEPESTNFPSQGQGKQSKTRTKATIVKKLRQKSVPQRAVAPAKPPTPPRQVAAADVPLYNVLPMMLGMSPQKESLRSGTSLSTASSTIYNPPTVNMLQPVSSASTQLPGVSSFYGVPQGQYAISPGPGGIMSFAGTTSAAPWTNLQTPSPVCSLPTDWLNKKTEKSGPTTQYNTIKQQLAVPVTTVQMDVTGSNEMGQTTIGTSQVGQVPGSGVDPSQELQQPTPGGALVEQYSQVPNADAVAGSSLMTQPPAETTPDQEGRMSGYPGIVSVLVGNSHSGKSAMERPAPSNFLPVSQTLLPTAAEYKNCISMASQFNTFLEKAFRSQLTSPSSCGSSAEMLENQTEVESPASIAMATMSGTQVSHTQTAVSVSKITECQMSQSQGPISVTSTPVPVTKISVHQASESQSSITVMSQQQTPLPTTTMVHSTKGAAKTPLSQSHIFQGSSVPQTKTSSVGTVNAGSTETSHKVCTTKAYNVSQMKSPLPSLASSMLSATPGSMSTGLSSKLQALVDRTLGSRQKRQKPTGSGPKSHDQNAVKGNSMRKVASSGQIITANASKTGASPPQARPNQRTPTTTAPSAAYNIAAGFRAQQKNASSLASSADASPAWKTGSWRELATPRTNIQEISVKRADSPSVMTASKNAPVMPLSDGRPVTVYPPYEPAVGASRNVEPSKNPEGTGPETNLPGRPDTQALHATQTCSTSPREHAQEAAPTELEQIPVRSPQAQQKNSGIAKDTTLEAKDDKEADIKPESMAASENVDSKLVKLSAGKAKIQSKKAMKSSQAVPTKTMNISEVNMEEINAEPFVEESKFHCIYCDKAFDTMGQRRRHQEWVCAKKTLAVPDAELITCDLCHKTYGSVPLLKAHLRRMHNIYQSKNKMKSESGADVKHTTPPKSGNETEPNTQAGDLKLDYERKTTPENAHNKSLSHKVDRYGPTMDIGSDSEKSASDSDTEVEEPEQAKQSSTEKVFARESEKLRAEKATTDKMKAEKMTVHDNAKVEIKRIDTEICEVKQKKRDFRTKPKRVDHQTKQGLVAEQPQKRSHLSAQEKKKRDDMKRWNFRNRSQVSLAVLDTDSSQFSESESESSSSSSSGQENKLVPKGKSSPQPSKPTQKKQTSHARPHLPSKRETDLPSTDDSEELEVYACVYCEKTFNLSCKLVAHQRGCANEHLLKQKASKSKEKSKAGAVPPKEKVVAEKKGNANKNPTRKDHIRKPDHTTKTMTEKKKAKADNKDNKRPEKSRSRSSTPTPLNEGSSKKPSTAQRVEKRANSLPSTPLQRVKVKRDSELDKGIMPAEKRPRSRSVTPVELSQQGKQGDNTTPDEEAEIIKPEVRKTRSRSITPVELVTQAEANTSKVDNLDCRVSLERLTRSRSVTPVDAIVSGTGTGLDVVHTEEKVRSRSATPVQKTTRSKSETSTESMSLETETRAAAPTQGGNQAMPLDDGTSVERKTRSRSVTPVSREIRPKSKTPVDEVENVEQGVLGDKRVSEERKTRSRSVTPVINEVQHKSETPVKEVGSVDVTDQCMVSEERKTRSRSGTPQEKETRTKSVTQVEGVKNMEPEISTDTSVSTEKKTRSRSATPEEEMKTTEPLKLSDSSMPVERKTRSRSVTPVEKQTQPKSATSETEGENAGTVTHSDANMSVEKKTRSRSVTPVEKQTQPKSATSETEGENAGTVTHSDANMSVEKKTRSRSVTPVEKQTQPKSATSETEGENAGTVTHSDANMSVEKKTRSRSVTPVEKQTQPKSATLKTEGEKAGTVTHSDANMSVETKTISRSVTPVEKQTLAKLAAPMRDVHNADPEMGNDVNVPVAKKTRSRSVTPVEKETRSDSTPGSVTCKTTWLAPDKETRSQSATTTECVINEGTALNNSAHVERTTRSRSVTPVEGGKVLSKPATGLEEAVKTLPEPADMESSAPVQRSTRSRSVTPVNRKSQSQSSIQGEDAGSTATEGSQENKVHLVNRNTGATTEESVNISKSTTPEEEVVSITPVVQADDPNTSYEMSRSRTVTPVTRELRSKSISPMAEKSSTMAEVDIPDVSATMGEVTSGSVTQLEDEPETLPEGATGENVGVTIGLRSVSLTPLGTEHDTLQEGSLIENVTSKIMELGSNVATTLETKPGMLSEGYTPENMTRDLRSKSLSPLKDAPQDLPDDVKIGATGLTSVVEIEKGTRRAGCVPLDDAANMVSDQKTCLERKSISRGGSLDEEKAERNGKKETMRRSKSRSVTPEDPPSSFDSVMPTQGTSSEQQGKFDKTSNLQNLDVDSKSDIVTEHGALVQGLGKDFQECSNVQAESDESIEESTKIEKDLDHSKRQHLSNEVLNKGEKKPDRIPTDDTMLNKNNKQIKTSANDKSTSEAVIRDHLSELVSDIEKSVELSTEIKEAKQETESQAQQQVATTRGSRKRNLEKGDYDCMPLQKHSHFGDQNKRKLDEEKESGSSKKVCKDGHCVSTTPEVTSGTDLESCSDNKSLETKNTFCLNEYLDAVKEPCKTVGSSSQIVTEKLVKSDTDRNVIEDKRDIFAQAAEEIAAVCGKEVLVQPLGNVTSSNRKAMTTEDTVERPLTRKVATSIKHQHAEMVARMRLESHLPDRGKASTTGQGVPVNKRRRSSSLEPEYCTTQKTATGDTEQGSPVTRGKANMLQSQHASRSRRSGSVETSGGKPLARRRSLSAEPRGNCGAKANTIETQRQSPPTRRKGSGNIPHDRKSQSYQTIVVETQQQNPSGKGTPGKPQKDMETQRGSPTTRQRSSAVEVQKDIIIQRVSPTTRSTAQESKMDTETQQGSSTARKGMTFEQQKDTRSKRCTSVVKSGNEMCTKSTEKQTQRSRPPNDKVRVTETRRASPTKVVETRRSSPTKVVETRTRSPSKVVEICKPSPTKLDTRRRSPTKVVQIHGPSSTKVVETRRSSPTEVVETRRPSPTKMTEANRSSPTGQQQSVTEHKDTCQRRGRSANASTGGPEKALDGCMESEGSSTRRKNVMDKSSKSSTEEQKARPKGSRVENDRNTATTDKGKVWPQLKTEETSGTSQGHVAVTGNRSVLEPGKNLPEKQNSVEDLQMKHSTVVMDKNGGKTTSSIVSVKDHRQPSQLAGTKIDNISEKIQVMEGGSTVEDSKDEAKKFLVQEMSCSATNKGDSTEDQNMEQPEGTQCKNSTHCDISPPEITGSVTVEKMEDTMESLDGEQTQNEPSIAHDPEDVESDSPSRTAAAQPAKPIVRPFIMWYKCVWCGESLDRFHLFEAHQAECKEKPQAETKVKCSTCGLKFSDADAMRFHVATEHTSASSDMKLENADKAVDSDAESSSTDASVFGGNQPMADPFQCSQQEDVFGGGSDHRCQSCGTVFPSNGLLQHHRSFMCTRIRRYGGKQFNCIYCKGQIRDLQKMKDHVLGRHSEVLEQDEELLVIYRNKDLLVLAELNYNVTDTEELGCKFCEDIYSSKMKLLSHMIDKHNKYSEYTCETCQKSFISERLLLQHMLQQHNSSASIRYTKPDKGTSEKPRYELKTGKQRVKREKEMCEMFSFAHDNKDATQVHRSRYSGLRTTTVPKLVLLPESECQERCPSPLLYGSDDEYVCSTSDEENGKSGVESCRPKCYGTLKSGIRLICPLCEYPREYDREFSLESHLKWFHEKEYTAELRVLARNLAPFTQGHGQVGHGGNKRGDISLFEPATKDRPEEIARTVTKEETVGSEFAEKLTGKDILLLNQMPGTSRGRKEEGQATRIQFVCNICQSRYVKRHNFVNHLRNVHKINLVERATEDQETKTETEVELNMTHEKCFRTYSRANKANTVPGNPSRVAGSVSSEKEQESANKNEIETENLDDSNLVRRNRRSANRSEKLPGSNKLEKEEGLEMGPESVTGRSTKLQDQCKRKTETEPDDGKQNKKQKVCPADRLTADKEIILSTNTNKPSATELPVELNLSRDSVCRPRSDRVLTRRSSVDSIQDKELCSEAAEERADAKRSERVVTRRSSMELHKDLRTRLSSDATETTEQIPIVDAKQHQPPSVSPLEMLSKAVTKPVEKKEYVCDDGEIVFSKVESEYPGSGMQTRSWRTVSRSPTPTLPSSDSHGSQHRDAAAKDGDKGTGQVTQAADRGISTRHSRPIVEASVVDHSTEENFILRRLSQDFGKRIAAAPSTIRKDCCGFSADTGSKRKRCTSCESEPTQSNNCGSVEGKKGPLPRSESMDNMGSTNKDVKQKMQISSARTDTNQSQNVKSSHIEKQSCSVDKKANTDQISSKDSDTDSNASTRVATRRSVGKVKSGRSGSPAKQVQERATPTRQTRHQNEGKESSYLDNCSPSQQDVRQTRRGKHRLSLAGDISQSQEAPPAAKSAKQTEEASGGLRPKRSCVSGRYSDSYIVFGLKRQSIQKNSSSPAVRRGWRK